MFFLEFPNLKKSLYLVSIFLLLLTISSCDSSGYQEHESGIEYKFFQENMNEAKPKVGDILVLEMTYKTEKDSVLFSTYDFSQSFRMRLNNSNRKGGTIDDAFLMLHKGDSARFKIDATNFYLYSKQTKVPSFIKKGDKLIFDIKLKKFFSQDDLLKEKQAARHESFEAEMTLLKRYLKMSNITEKPTKSGIYFIEEKKGNGIHPKNKSLVAVHYIGSFINGKPFENSYKLHKPLQFKLGENAVIPGFEEAVKLMTVGSRAKVIIPSNMAYGKEIKTSIPPYSTLVFQLELMSLK